MHHRHRELLLFRDRSHGDPLIVQPDDLFVPGCLDIVRFHVFSFYRVMVFPCNTPERRRTDLAQVSFCSIARRYNASLEIAGGVF